MHDMTQDVYNAIVLLQYYLLYYYYTMTRPSWLYLYPIHNIIKQVIQSIPSTINQLHYSSPHRKGRFLAHPVHQPIRPKMHKHGMNRRHGTKDRARDGEDNPLTKEGQPVPGPAIREPSIDIAAAELGRIVPSSLQTDRVPPVVKRYADIHPHKGCKAQKASELECECDVRVKRRLCERGELFIYHRENEQDGEVTRQEVRFPEKMHQRNMPRLGEKTAPAEPDPADCISRCEARVESPPHVSQGLSVACNAGVHRATEPWARQVARDIALACRGVDDARDEAAACLEVALEHHVHVLSDRGGVAVPAADSICKHKREGVDGRWDGDGRVRVHGGQAGKAP